MSVEKTTPESSSLGSLSDTKEKATEGAISFWTREQCVDWLRSVGVPGSISGTKNDLIKKIKQFKKYPNLLQKFETRAKRQYSFPASLPPNQIPPNTSLWKQENFPEINKSVFENCCKFKRQGVAGQQEKAHKLFTSRKIASVKTIKEGNFTYVKAVIKKSYGNVSRPAVIEFSSDGNPERGHCTCPVGLCGVCCHTLCLLHFLVHLTETGEKFLELTATQQLQKWHKKGKPGKGSVPMLPVHKLVHVPSARIKKLKKRENLSEGFRTRGDLEKSALKRNVEKSMSKYGERFNAIGLKNIENHFNSVLQASELGRKTSLGLQLNYKFTSVCQQVIALEHDYCLQSELVITPGNRPNNSSIAITTFSADKSNELTNAQKMTGSKILVDYINDFSDIELQIKSQWDIHFSKISKFPKEIKLDINGKKAIEPKGTNYCEVLQNTDSWQKLRQDRVTASKWPYLIGLHGEAKFQKYWFCVKNNVSEQTMVASQIQNFERGHKYEDTAVKHFEKVSGSTASKCGFFIHPDDPKYGASPDAICTAPFLLEVKTRAEKSDAPLANLSGEHLVQAQLQMSCTGFRYVIVESFLPEKNNANFFLVPKDELFLSVLKQITDSILTQTTIDTWSHCEQRDYQLIGEKLSGIIPNYSDLRSLRSYINKVAKSLPLIIFQ